jgi:hypothetical protein
MTWEQYVYLVYPAVFVGMGVVAWMWDCAVRRFK